MTTVWRITVKEVKERFRNWRWVLGTVFINLLLMPIFIGGMYGLMISTVTRRAVGKMEIAIQGAEYAPTVMAYFQENDELYRVVLTEDVARLVETRGVEVGILIPKNFETALATGEQTKLIVYAGTGGMYSATATSRVESIFEQISRTIVTERLSGRGIAPELLTPFLFETVQVQGPEQRRNSVGFLFIPALIMSFTLTGSMSLMVDMFTGEKERRTFEPLMFTPVSRLSLVLGKLFAVFLLSSFAWALNLMSWILVAVVIGMFFLNSLKDVPIDAIQNLTTSAADVTPDANFVLSDFLPILFSPGNIVLVFLALLLVILFGLTIQLLISLLAKSEVEASNFMAPLMIISYLPMVAAVVLDDITVPLWLYGVPFLGAIMGVRDLIAVVDDYSGVVVMFVSSILFVGLLLVGVILVFQNEDVLFRSAE